MENTENNTDCVEKNLNGLQKYLIGIGLSNCRSSYSNSTGDQAFEFYMEKDPREISFIWNYLDERTKMEYLRRNMDKAFSFLKDSNS